MRPKDYTHASIDLESAVLAARQRAKSGYPNPGRMGCPDQELLRRLALRDVRLTAEGLPLSHLTHCSPCFQEYVRLRHRVRLGQVARLAAVAAVIAAVLLGLLNHLRQHSTTAQRSLAVVRGSATSDAKGSVRPSNDGEDLLAMNIDLSSFSPTRGDEAAISKKPLDLPRKHLRITFLLPVGLEPGNYAFRLLDRARHIVIDREASATLRGGVTSLLLDLDLRSQSPGPFTMMIRPPGLRWRSIPVLVE